MNFDDDGNILPQKIKFMIWHDEETKEEIDEIVYIKESEKKNGEIP